MTHPDFLSATCVPQSPPVVIVTPDALVPPEAEPLIERLQAKVVNAADLVVWLRHLEHALTKPWPLPRSNSLVDTRPPSARLELEGADGHAITCRSCSEPAQVVAGSGPHAASARCHCGAWRWISRRELEAAGIDPAALTAPNDASRLTLGGAP